MRSMTRTLAVAGMFAAAAVAKAQQPEILHAQLTTHAADHGLQAELSSLAKANGPVWVGYTIPTSAPFHSGWKADRVAYLEGDHYSQNYEDKSDDRKQDHATLLVKLEAGAVSKLRVEDPERTIDAGGQSFVWLTNVNANESARVLQQTAIDTRSQSLRDSAVFLLALHRADEAMPMLLALAAPAKDEELREKAAFWMAAQRGHEGFVALQRFAREDADARFREKITFDLTVTHDPGAVDELVRMAHSDASPRVRRQAQFWMATKGGARAAGGLRTAVASDSDQGVRKSAVFALSRLPGDQAATQLIEVAGSSKDPEVRKQAIFWLGQSDDPRALEYLTKLITSKSSQ